MPETNTDGLGAVGTAWPPCAQVTTAPMCKIGPGMRLLPSLRPDDRQGRHVDRDGRPDEGDRRALPVADVDARLVDDDHRPARALEDDAARGGRGRPVAEDERILAGRL